jgi:hypothetical protein
MKCSGFAWNTPTSDITHHPRLFPALFTKVSTNICAVRKLCASQHVQIRSEMPLEYANERGYRQATDFAKRRGYELARRRDKHGAREPICFRRRASCRLIGL